MKKVITSYSVIKAPEGKRLSYTYSEIDDAGNIIKQNERASFAVLDEVILGHIQAIEDSIQLRLTAQ
jgi:hypothetical protein